MKLQQLHEAQFITDEIEIRKFLTYNNKVATNQDNIVVHPDGTVDAAHDIFFETKFDKGKLPIKFGRVVGSFNVSACGLKTLQGCPKIIFGRFDCSGNKLKSLAGGPETVEDVYIARNNPINRLDDTYISKCYRLDVRNCKLTNLRNIHKSVKSTFEIYVDDNPIESHVLGVMLIKELDVVYFEWYGKSSHTEAARALEIINYCLENEYDLHHCQELLLEANLSEYAKL